MAVFASFHCLLVQPLGRVGMTRELIDYGYHSPPPEVQFWTAALGKGEESSNQLLTKEASTSGGFARLPCDDLDGPHRLLPADKVFRPVAGVQHGVT